MKDNPFMPEYIKNIYACLIGPQLIDSRLNAPLKRKKPARIGVQFMGDLFHDDCFNISEISGQKHSVLNSMLGGDYGMLKIWDIMCRCWSMPGYPRHTFMVLTKRPKNMADWVFKFFADENNNPRPYPKNIWLGVSVSTQEDADRLIPILLQIPAAVRWVSAEPLLENITIDFKLELKEVPTPDGFGYIRKPAIDWLVIGCESGAKRRQCKIEWIESLVKQGNEAGIPVFVKQAEIGGKVVSMPEILGRVWAEYPK